MGKKRQITDAKEPEVIIIDSDDADIFMDAKRQKKKEKQKKSDAVHRPNEPNDDIIFDTDAILESPQVVNIDTDEEDLKKFMQKMYECEAKEIFLGDDISPLHKMIPEFRHLKDSDLDQARDLGITIKRGPYSEAECETIKEVFKEWTLMDMKVKGIDFNEDNYNDYMIDLLGFFKHKPKSHQNSVAASVGVSMLVPRKSQLKHRIVTKLILCIGKRLPDRTLKNLYLKSRDLMSPLLMPKDLSVDQQREVLDYMIAHPTLTPAQIALRFNIALRSVHILKANAITKTSVMRKTGPWSPDEDAELLKSVLKVIGSNEIEDSLRKDIDWVQVASLVKTRTLKHCQSRFMKCLQWKIGVTDLIGSGSVETRMMDAAKIIFVIHRSMNDRRMKGQYNDIDWNALNDAMPHLGMRNMMALFDSLLDGIPKEYKENHITFKKQVRHLYEVQIPKLIGISGDTHAQLEQFWNQNF